MSKTAGCSLLMIAVAFGGLTACNRAVDSAAENPAPAGTMAADSDPASGNLAPAQATSVSTYSTSTAPRVARNYPPNYGNTDYDLPADNRDYPADSGYYAASNDQPIETTEPPPPLPEYSQPEIPGDNYYWTPGYWAYAQGEYYWVPGAWVLAPWVDALWTPPYWDYEGSHYRWHSGYWGPHVGFYGGINYGFGYTGRGYYGAYWNHGTLNYNRSVTNVQNASVRNVYNYSVPGNQNSRISYNGGHGGINVRPSPQEMAVVRDPRTPPVSAQFQHAREASANRAQFSSGGRAPAALVAARPLSTNYRAPAATPPDAAMRAVGRPGTENRGQERRNEPPAAESRSIPVRPIPEPVDNRAGPPNRPFAPEVRQAQVPPIARPVQQEQSAPPSRPVPDYRQESAPQPSAPRPMPEVRNAPPRDVAPRPVPEIRNAPPPVVAPRQAPEVRSAPQGRPAPEVHPAPQARQAPENRPASQQPAAAPRQAPEARPAPPPAVVHAAPEGRPGPQGPKGKPEDRKDK